jgi:HSP20 family protein
MTRKPVEMSEYDQHIQERMRQAYQRVFGSSPGSPGFGQRYMEPPCDVYQTESHVVVLMDIAGIPDEEIELEVDGRRLIISGERKPLGSDSSRRSYSQMEITTGPFRRELFLPAEVDAENSEAVYHSGILKITLPISRPATGRHLRIIVR